MRKRVLSTHLLLILLALVTIKVYAREPQYVYIQSEHDQPYHVYVNGKTYNSNATGYLLIPQLAKGNYTIQIGFVNSAISYEFTFAIGEEDKGFSLKQGIDNGLTLFDLVNFNSIRGSLAMERPKNTPAAPIAKDAGGIGTVKEATTTVNEKKPAPVAAPIRKIYEKVSEEGVDQVYIVPKSDGKADTVIIFVPALKPVTYTVPATRKNIYALQISHSPGAQPFTRRRFFYL